MFRLLLSSLFDLWGWDVLLGGLDLVGREERWFFRKVWIRTGIYGGVRKCPKSLWRVFCTLFWRFCAALKNRIAFDLRLRVLAPCRKETKTVFPH